jgi:curved DNA-binding protein CbpA
MDNYYEVLGLSPESETEAIRATCESQYNEWRKRVIHHDPEVVEKANANLRKIEEARAILLDPEKRAQYDARLGRGTIGGLGDPLKHPETPPSVPGRGAKGRRVSTPATEERFDAWVCEQCQTVNPMGTRFCGSCGARLADECPECDTLVKVNATFCPNCGIDVKQAREQKQMEEKEAEARRIREERRRAEREALLAPLSEKAETANKLKNLGCILSFFFTPIGLVLWPIAMFNARHVLKAQRVSGDEFIREEARKAWTWSLIPFLIFGSFLLISILLLLGGGFLELLQGY